MRDLLPCGYENWGAGSMCRLILLPPNIIIVPNSYLCCNYTIQQIKASDIWRQGEHEGLPDCFLKIQMKETESDPPTIRFKGSTDDSQLNIRLQIDYKGMNEFVNTYAHKLTLFVAMLVVMKIICAGRAFAIVTRILLKHTGMHAYMGLVPQ